MDFTNFDRDYTWETLELEFKQVDFDLSRVLSYGSRTLRYSTFVEDE